MLGVRKRVKRMVRAVEHSGSTPCSRRASDDDVGGVGHNSQGGVLSIFESQQRQRSFNSPRPLPLTGGVSGPLLLGGGSNGGGQPPTPGRGSGRGSGAKGEGGSGRGSGRSDDTRGLSSQLNSSRDAQNSSGDDTPGLPLSRIHSYSKMRPVIGGEAAAVSPFPASGGGGICFAPSASGPLGLRPPSFSSGPLGIRPPSFTSGRPASFSSRGKASELAVLAGLRQASLGRGGFGAVMAGDKPPPQPNLPTMNEGSFGGAAAVSELYSSQQSKQGSASPPRPHRRQNTDVNLDRLSGEKLTRQFLACMCMGW